MKEKIISWNKVPRGTKVQVKNLMDEEWKEAYFEETYDGCFYFYKAKINDNIDLYKYCKIHPSVEIPEEWCYKIK